MKTLTLNISGPVFLVILFAFNRVGDIKRATYDAYLSGSMNLWEKAVTMSRQDHLNDPSNETLFNVALAEYGLLNATMKDQDEEVFDSYIDDAVRNCETLVEEGYKSADCNAILSALTGLKIAYSPWKGMFLGPKSSSYITEALALDTGSPIVQQLYGNQLNFTPKMWGGDPQKAIEAYQKAISIYEKNHKTDVWMYLDAHAWLGMVYKKENEPEQARKIWNKALAAEPGFGWVKYSLLPSLDAPAQNQN